MIDTADRITVAFYVAMIASPFLMMLAEWILPCPREIKRYDCLGWKCDHSRKAVKEARAYMARRPLR